MTWFEWLQSMVASYGYVAVAIGTFFEGEIMLALGAAAAHRGWLDLKNIVLIGLVFGFLGDQIYFWIGLRYGNRILARFPSLAAKSERVKTLFKRYDALLVILLRFTFGLRIAGPIILGTCGIPAWRLALLNFIGVLIWVPIVVSIGWFLSQTLQHAIGEMQTVQQMILVVLAVIVAVTGLAIFIKRRL